MGQMFVGSSLVFGLVLLVIAILWIALPFAVFGTKPLLRELIDELKKNNQLLANIQSNTAARTVAATREPPVFADR